MSDAEASSPALSAARTLLDCVNGPGPASLEMLAFALDALLLAYHATPEGEAAAEDGEPPEWNFIEAVGDRFTALGLYAVVDPLAPEPAQAMIGDAIDGLCDLARDMSEVLWRADRFGSDDASGYFRLTYSRWGRHARELGLYLHALRFAG